jgi:transposase-like protein
LNKRTGRRTIQKSVAVNERLMNKGMENFRRWITDWPSQNNSSP